MMTKQEVLEACINKQLEKYDIGYNDVKKGGGCEIFEVETFIEQPYLFGLFTRKVKIFTYKQWYLHYTFNSSEEYESWKEFCINLFRKELKLSKVKAEQQFVWLDFNYGLKQNYEITKK